MSFGQALGNVLERKRISQIKAGKLANVSNSLVSKIIKGERAAQPDVMKAAAVNFDEPELYFLAMHEITDGAFATWLNNVDLHHAAVALKALEESQEADDAIRSAPLAAKPDELSEKDMKALHKLLKEVREDVNAKLMLIAVICRTHGFSWASVWKEHNQYMRSKNYVK